MFPSNSHSSEFAGGDGEAQASAAQHFIQFSIKPPLITQHLSAMWAEGDTAATVWNAALFPGLQ